MKRGLMKKYGLPVLGFLLLFVVSCIAWQVFWACFENEMLTWLAPNDRWSFHWIDMAKSGVPRLNMIWFALFVCAWSGLVFCIAKFWGKWRALAISLPLLIPCLGFAVYWHYHIKSVLAQDIAHFEASYTAVYGSIPDLQVPLPYQMIETHLAWAYSAFFLVLCIFLSFLYLKFRALRA